MTDQEMRDTLRGMIEDWNNLTDEQRAEANAIAAEQAAKAYMETPSQSGDRPSVRLGHGRVVVTTEERFWSHVTKGDGCWEWDHPAASGYGAFQWKGRPYGAHRASYLLFVGPIPGAMVVRHTCDNRRCVRPDHLTVGTHKDNAQDTVLRGRKPKHYDPLISLRSAALILGVTPDTLRQQVHRGKLKATMLGGWHVRQSEVARYQKESKR